eukprot:TRINITY_DN68902_c0_g1_i1.p1 TRINITY_DN68902_c0_g1~~TRINITY_DN68902_c0_g1_i1.p1  ORF type:complete len:416 (+),score=111.37 TRINITY_DN68902_c0_g1_i1:89-1336(+)
MAQEHQEYIQQKVNPILENLVTQLLLERPEHLSQFMIKWLSEHAKTPAAAALTEGVNEFAELKEELEQLQKEVKQLEEETGAGSSGPEAACADGSKEKKGDGDEGNSESEEEEDDDVEHVPPPAAYMNRGPRASVSAEAYGDWNKKGHFTAPVFPKTEVQKNRIRDVLQRSFLFSSLERNEVNVLVDAMQEKEAQAGQRILEQGEDGDCLFVVEEGQMNCYKKQGEEEEKLVKECKAGDAFGELALLYNCPRAASVVAHTRCVLWQLDRASFNNIVKDAASKRRERYDEFLKSVPVLQSMDAYERTTMCDALTAQTFRAGETVVRQGESGETFYILEDGQCVASKIYVKGTPPQEVMSYGSGDYFGELALLSGEPRAATVTCKTDCKLLVLSRRTFKSLLGNLEDILRRNASLYK